MQLKRQSKTSSDQSTPRYCSSLIPIQSGSSQKKPVFMVPGIIGEGEETTKFFFGFARIAHYLDKEQPFYTFNPWGIIEEEQNFRPVEVIATDYIQAIRDFQTEGPYFLGGECVGGVIAFEMAQQLTAQGEKVELLFLLDTQPPNNDGTLLNYKPQPYLGRAVLLATEERLRQKPTLTWSQLVTGRLEIQTIPGMRSNYIREQAQTIGEKLRIYLDGNYPSPASDQIRQESEKNFVGPRDELEHELTHIWKGVLGIHSIGVKDNFFDLGGNSLLAVNLFAEIEKTFHKNLSVATLFQAQTVEQLASFLRQEKWAASWHSLVRIQPSGSKPPLFLIHPCNGDISIYRVLAQHLGLERPIYGLQAVGLDEKQAPFDRVEQMAAHYIKEIQTVQPEGPYFLGGKQIGGWVAFEMAQQLVSQGHQVELVVFFGGVSNRKPFVRFNREWTSRQIEQLLLLGPSYVLKRVKEISQMKTTTKGKVKLSIEQALANYLPQIYHGRVAIFQPIDSYNCESPELDREPQIYLSSRSILCSKTFAGGFEVHYIPGSDAGDYTAYKEPNVRIFAEKLRVCLDRNHDLSV